MKKYLSFFVISLLLCSCVLNRASKYISNLTMPNTDWKMMIDLNGFYAFSDKMLEDSTKRVIKAEKRELSLWIDISMKKADYHFAVDAYGFGDPSESKTFNSLPDNNINYFHDNFKKFDHGIISCVEYDSKANNARYDWFHTIEAYLAYRGYLVTVRIRKQFYVPVQRALLTDILNSIKIAPNKRPTLGN